MAYILIWIVQDALGRVLQTSGEWVKEGYAYAKTFAKIEAKVPELFSDEPQAVSAQEVCRRKNSWFPNPNRIVHRIKS